ncbi:MAG: hypothetical protein QOK22_2817 [Gaiellaceae bacterium]|nr:hypothetical protein [Gaiellaceae bacterium]
MRRGVVLTGIVCAALAAASTAPAATSECKGLQVCVPVAGPWVLATATQTEFQLDCPKRFIVAGLDAELSRREIDVGFVGGLGSPVNPGITTTGSAVFLGRFVGATGVATFRPHIGCVPASGGGQRTPTAYQVFKPGKPTTRVVKELVVLPTLTLHLAARCPAGQRLVSATHAVGFYGNTPPTLGVAQSVHVTQQVRNGIVHISANGGTGRLEGRTIVQVDLVCAVRA